MEIPIFLMPLWARFLFMEYSPKDVFKPSYKTANISSDETNAQADRLAQKCVRVHCSIGIPVVS